MSELPNGEPFQMGKKTAVFHAKISIVLLTTAIIISRGLTLTHNMQLHPDERVFVESSVSILKALEQREYSYEGVKPYPEGAFVLQVPFHAIRYIVTAMTGTEQDPYLWGRIAGVFYFVIGWLIGATIVYTWFEKTRLCLLTYGLIMCFSLLQIEQSRYGTGDPISFALLNLILFSTAHSLTQKKKSWFYLASMAAGMTGAVKYPLVFFALIPLLSIFPLCRSKTDGWGFPTVIKGIVLMVCGFLLLSPKVVQDWHYLQRVFASETEQYLNGGSISEVGGPGNHFLSVVIYHLLYSDIPFGIVFFAVGVVTYRKKTVVRGSECATDILFGRLVPLLAVLFLSYNIFVPLLYFRTLYPYFCISILYSSYAVGNWINNGGGKKGAAIVFVALMVFRGSYLVDRMTERRPNDYLLQCSKIVTDGKEQRVIFLEPIQLRGLYVPGKIVQPEGSEMIQIDRFLDQENEVSELRPGDLVITANFDFGRAQKYLLPVGNPTVKLLIDTWDQFKEINEPYLRVETYPKWIYYLFGYWLKGSSAGSLEFPENAIYYREPDQ